MKPGGIVYIDKYLTKFDGYWYVRSIRHEMTTNNLQTYMEVVKDSIDSDLPKFPNVPLYDPPNNTTYLNDRWVASYEYEEVYA